MKGIRKKLFEPSPKKFVTVELDTVSADTPTQTVSLSPEAPHAVQMCGEDQYQLTRCYRIEPGSAVHIPTSILEFVKYDWIQDS